MLRFEVNTLEMVGLEWRRKVDRGLRLVSQEGLNTVWTTDDLQVVDEMILLAASVGHSPSVTAHEGERRG